MGKVEKSRGGKRKRGVERDRDWVRGRQRSRKRKNSENFEFSFFSVYLEGVS